MANRKSNFVVQVLEGLFDVAQLLPRPLETPYGWAKRVRRLTYKEYYDAMYHLHKRGIVRIHKENGKNFIELTEKGSLEILVQKVAIQIQSKWDGKWRMVIFDIPEDAHLQRDRLRRLLKKHGFHKLQASVFIHPFPFNREAIAYLKESGLMRYIRMIKIEEMDDDADLKKKFKL